MRKPLMFHISLSVLNEMEIMTSISWTLNGKNLQNLTNSPTHEFKPAFSPDGQRMAYVSSRHDGYLEIYVMNLNTKVSHRLTNHPRHDA